MFVLYRNILCKDQLHIKNIIDIIWRDSSVYSSCFSIMKQYNIKSVNTNFVYCVHFLCEAFIFGIYHNNPPAGISLPAGDLVCQQETFFWISLIFWGICLCILEQSSRRSLNFYIHSNIYDIKWFAIKKFE